jgi:DNA-binding HxlR family transcriptional regulator
MKLVYQSRNYNLLWKTLYYAKIEIIVMEEEPKDIIVLGAIKKGAKKFGKIRDKTGIDPEELNKILEKLEERGFIRVEKKKGLFGGEKIELYVTDKGSNELDQRIHEMQENWQRMVQLYKSGDKQKLQDFMDTNKSFFPMMMFFGIMDMIMFSMMFSMIGVMMHNYVPPEQIPPGAENQPADAGDGGADAGGDMGDGGYDIDIGF